MPFRVINAQNYPYERYEKDEDKELPGRFFIAPDFGLVLGDLTRIEVSPSLGYHLTPRFIMGIGGRYEYVRKRNFITRQIDVNTHVYGYRLFSRLIVIEDLADIVPIQVPIGIFGHIEFEGLSLEERHFRLGAAPDIEGRFWLNSVLAGAGINQPTGPRSSFNVMVLWDITNSASSPYINPILKFGIQFYLGRAN
jgi:hypothetical protein